MADHKPDLLRGTLDLLILEVLAEGPLHGYAIGQRIQELSGELLRIEQGSLYPSLYRMHRRGWLRSRSGTSDNGRRVRLYTLTASGRRQLAAESATWSAFATGVGRVLQRSPRKGGS